MTNTPQGNTDAAPEIAASELFLAHIRTLPTTLDTSLLASIKGGKKLMIIGGDFSIELLHAGKMPYRNLHKHGYTGEQVLILSTPDVSFAYDPDTGVEILNNMESFGIMDRSNLLAGWRWLYEMDTADLHAKGLGDFAHAQAIEVERLLSLQS